ncbi:MAG: copper transporter [Acidimicrobiales bacterium]
MINFRYHIVSIVAVFLALGIGTALGGTFLDRYTVDRLDRGISSAEARIKATEGQNNRLVRLIDQGNKRNDSLLQDGGAQLLRGHLTDVPVLLVTAPGVDAQVVADLRRAVDQADAELRGTLELRPGLFFEERADDDVAAAVGEKPNATRAVRQAVLDQLRTALRASAATSTSSPRLLPGSTTSTTVQGSTTTTTASATPRSTTTVESSTTTAPGETPSGDTFTAAPDGSQPPIINTLLAADYARYVPGPGLTVDDPMLATIGYRYIFVSGPDLDGKANRLLLDLLSGAASDPLPAVVVSSSVPDDGKDRIPTAVAEVRASKTLAARYSTVDDVDTFVGLVATVLTLEQPSRVAPGHYGQGAGATSILPPA